MMMQANTPGQDNGVSRYWIDGEQGHELTGIGWRDVPELGLNRVRLHHYIETGDAQSHSNVVWFDDVVVSTEPIGCD
jgi:hypothetical protein